MVGVGPGASASRQACNGPQPRNNRVGQASNQATEAKSEPGVAAAIDGQFPRSALREAKQSLSHIDCSDDTDPVSRPKPAAINTYRQSRPSLFNGEGIDNEEVRRCAVAT